MLQCWEIWERLWLFSANDETKSKTFYQTPLIWYLRQKRALGEPARSWPLDNMSVVMTLPPLRPCNVDSSLVDGMMQKPNSAITLYLLFLHSIITILKISLNWLSLSKTGRECLNLDKKWTSTSITCTVWPQDPFSRQNYEPEDVFWYQRITIRSANVPSLLTCYVSRQNVYIEKPNASSCPWP